MHEYRSISEALTLLMDRHALSDNELQRRTGVAQPTISRIKNGERRHPRSTTIQPLADFFCISLAQLRGEELLPWEMAIHIQEPNDHARYHQKPVPSAYVAIPYVTARDISNGFGCIPPDQSDIASMDISRACLQDLKTRPETTVLVQASGDAMSPIINHRSLIIVDHDDDPPLIEGRIILAMLEGELFIRKIQQTPRYIHLIPVNPEYRTITLSRESPLDSLRILGRVVSIWQRCDCI